MKYGFIGLGNMATAILRGMKGSSKYNFDEVYGYDISDERCSMLGAELGLQILANEVETVITADVVVFAVKPQMLADVFVKVKDSMTSDKLIITIAAGKPLSFYEDVFTGCPVVRIMPNINAKVNCAVSGLCGGKYADNSHKDIARTIFESVGTVVEITEKQFPAFSAIGGASGAFVLMMLDSMASAGVKAGLPRKLAYEVACQVVMGSAKLASESEEHPIALVDQICSPGGTTIEGVHTLKKRGYDSAIIEAIGAIIDKDIMLSK